MKDLLKKWWFWLIIIVIIVIIASSQGGDKIQQTNKTSEVSTNEDKVKELKIGETWTIEGQWNLTIDSVSITEQRNQFSDKTPKQVVYVTYSYENLGYEDDTGVMEGLYFDLEPGLNVTAIDGNGEVAYSYPNSVTTHPQQTPIGAKCVNAQSCIGLNNESDSITMNISKYDSKGKQQKVTYKLDVK